jgi:hypothetical protein
MKLANGLRLRCGLCGRTSAPITDHGRPGSFLAVWGNGWNTAHERDGDAIVCAYCLSSPATVATRDLCSRAGSASSDAVDAGTSRPTVAVPGRPIEQPEARKPKSLSLFADAAAEYLAATGRQAPVDGASRDAWDEWTSWLKRRNAKPPRASPTREPRGQLGFFG